MIFNLIGMTSDAMMDKHALDIQLAPLGGGGGAAPSGGGGGGAPPGGGGGGPPPGGGGGGAQSGGASPSAALAEVHNSTTEAMKRTNVNCFIFTNFADSRLF